MKKPRPNRYWTDERIEQGIRDVLAATGLERMPKRSEIEKVFKDGRLSNAILRNGGFYGWAERLGMPKWEMKTIKCRKCGKEIEVGVHEIQLCAECRKERAGTLRYRRIDKHDHDVWRPTMATVYGVVYGLVRLKQTEEDLAKEYSVTVSQMHRFVDYIVRRGIFERAWAKINAPLVKQCQYSLYHHG